MKTFITVPVARHRLTEKTTDIMMKLLEASKHFDQTVEASVQIAKITYIEPAHSTKEEHKDTGHPDVCLVYLDGHDSPLTVLIGMSELLTRLNEG